MRHAGSGRNLLGNSRKAGRGGARGVKHMKKMLRTLAPLFVVLVVATGLSSGAALPALATDYQAQVVGGTEVPNGKYPFVTALLDTRGGSTAYQQQFCGGSLIDEDSVLTAAHCVVRTSPQPLRVTVGRTVLNSNQGQVRRVSRIFIHPDYREKCRSCYDAAVLKLGASVSGIAPIKLAASNQNVLENPGRKARIAGWGNTHKQSSPFYSEPDNYPNRMHAATVPLVSDARAKEVYRSRYVSSLMVAAGKGGKDACQGDSGGPMWATTPQGRRQIGVTSFGAGCGDKGHPGVYTEVNAPSIRNFITNAANR
jgi:secreted trypsin-like serine protease